MSVTNASRKSKQNTEKIAGVKFVHEGSPCQLTQPTVSAQDALSTPLQPMTTWKMKPIRPYIRKLQGLSPFKSRNQSLFGSSIRFLSRKKPINSRNMVTKKLYSGKVILKTTSVAVNVKHALTNLRH